MRRLIIAAAIALTLALSGNVYAWTMSGTLRQPFDMSWNNVGFTDHPGGQIFMEYYMAVGKYHMAEDWNGNCAEPCDLGAPLYAIGDGFVKDVQYPGSGTIGRSLIVRYTLPDGSQVDSVYWHIQDIYVSVGANVQKGDKIATIGNATSNDYPNGLYPAHLHWEIRKGTAGLNLNWNTDSYLNSAKYPDSIEIRPPSTSPPTSGAMDYTSPSLFVDDRAKSDVHGLSSGSWTYFSVPSNAPSSTAYVEYGTGRYSLKRAVDNNLIYSQVWVQINGLWYYYPDITKVLFDAGKTYAVYGFVPNANLYILTPGHQYQADRAKIDMIRSVKDNTNIKSAYVKSAYVQSWSDASYSYWMMPFAYDNGSGLKFAYVEQATLILNPIMRYTIFYDPATGWTSWVAVDPNVLY